MDGGLHGGGLSGAKKTAAAAVMGGSSRKRLLREETEEEGSREIDKMFKMNRWEDPAYRLNYFCLMDARTAAVFNYVDQVHRMVDACFPRSRHLKRYDDEQDADGC